MHGIVVEDLAVEVLAELPPAGRAEVLDLLGRVCRAPRVWPDVADPGSVEEIREAWGAHCWVQYTPRAGAVEVRDIGWAG